MKKKMQMTNLILFYPLLNNNLLDQSKLKVLADDKISVTKKLKFVLERLENVVEKEKMLVTSIFSCSHNVFKRLLFQGGQKSGLFRKGLNDDSSLK